MGSNRSRRVNGPQDSFPAGSRESSSSPAATRSITWKSPRVSRTTQQEVIAEINQLNGILAEDRVDPEIQTRIAQYEMAFRMQASVPELTDFSREPRAMLDLYGVKEPGTEASPPTACLPAASRNAGVRMIQLYHRAWDHHGDIEKAMPSAAADVDRASAALIRDLKQRGLLDDTLILWGGEFGRTPWDRAPDATTTSSPSPYLWPAEAAAAEPASGRRTNWATGSVDDVVSVHDLHATMLALMGVDHRQLTVKYQGLDARLTGIAGNIVRGVMA